MSVSQISQIWATDMSFTSLFMYARLFWRIHGVRHPTHFKSRRFEIWVRSEADLSYRFELQRTCINQKRRAYIKRDLHTLKETWKEIWKKWLVYIKRDVQIRAIGWRKSPGCLIFLGHFPKESPVISGSFAESDVQLKASYASSPPCIGTLGHIPQKSPMISGSFAKSDVQPQAFYASSPPCTQSANTLYWRSRICQYPVLAL